MDKISKKVGTEILSVYKSQNVLQLAEWFERFPNAIEILEHALEEAPIKHALSECLWLSLAFLLSVPNATRKGLQIATARNNPHPVCHMILQSHVQKKESSQLELMQFMHVRVVI